MDRRLAALVSSLTLALIAGGCTEPGGDFKTVKQIKNEKQAAGHDDYDHEHGAAGPHGGAIVELGDEEYHAEVVVDAKTNTLTVYLFGKDAKTPSPIAATEIIVVTEDNEKHALKAVAVEGKAAEFSLQDEAKVGAITKAGYLHGSLQLEVDGKPYRGDIDAHFDGATHEEPAATKAPESKPAEPTTTEPTKTEPMPTEEKPTEEKPAEEKPTEGETGKPAAKAETPDAPEPPAKPE